MLKKRCFVCGQVKELEEFYRHKVMADGHLNKCKKCACDYARRHRAANRERCSNYEQQRKAKPERKAQKLKCQTARRQKQPLKYKAWEAVRVAVKNGKLIPQPCFRCGNPKSQAHHHDYSKPLDVVWECFKCHREHEHGQVVVSNYGQAS